MSVAINVFLCLLFASFAFLRGKQMGHFLTRRGWVSFKTGPNSNAAKPPLILEDIHAAIAAIHHMIKTSPAAGIERARRRISAALPNSPGPSLSAVSRSVAQVVSGKQECPSSHVRSAGRQLPTRAIADGNFPRTAYAAASYQRCIDAVTMHAKVAER